MPPRRERRWLAGPQIHPERRQDEQAQGGRGQMGDLIERAGAQQAELNVAVDHVENQRYPGEQDRIGPRPDRAQPP